MWWILACSGGADGTDSTDSPAGPPAPSYLARPVGEPSGTCPDFTQQGMQNMKSNDVKRDVWAWWPNNLPEEPIGVMFAWHGLGDTAENFAESLDLESIAKSNNILVLAPGSANPIYTWDYINNGGDDIALYDDLRACATTAFNIDLDQVTSMGFSYGALWTTWLSMHHDDTLAAALVFSGGTGVNVALPYVSPTTDIPVLGNWGGSSDSFDAGFVVVDFEATMAEYLTSLASDGHIAIGCDHGLGHSMPNDYPEQIEAFLLTHRFGVASPFEGGGTAGLPDYCSP